MGSIGGSGSNRLSWNLTILLFRVVMTHDTYWHVHIQILNTLLKLSFGSVDLDRCSHVWHDATIRNSPTRNDNLSPKPPFASGNHVIFKSSSPRLAGFGWDHWGEWKIWCESSSFGSHWGPAPFGSNSSCAREKHIIESNITQRMKRHLILSHSHDCGLKEG